MIDAYEVELGHTKKTQVYYYWRDLECRPPPVSCRSIPNTERLTYQAIVTGLGLVGRYGAGFRGGVLVGGLRHKTCPNAL